MSSNDYQPILRTTNEVSTNVINTIEEERSGKQLGLKTPFKSLNIAVGKYLRFGTVTSINGLSGHSKSYFLNILIQSFLNYELNMSKYIKEYIIPYHCFEMKPEDEVLRSLSNKTEKSYHYLLSSEYDKTTGLYNTINDEELKNIKIKLKELQHKNLYYFDIPTTLSNIGKNVKYSIEYYQDTNKTIIVPDVVIPIDHTLLIKQNKDEKTILDTMRAIASTSIALKKKGYMILFLGQLNNNIENPERINNNLLHYPKKSDIYAQGEIYNACDNVWCLHQPELLGLSLYGKNKYPTSNLIHLLILKQRFGSVGSIFLENILKKGKLIEKNFKKV